MSDEIQDFNEENTDDTPEEILDVDEENTDDTPEEISDVDEENPGEKKAAHPICMVHSSLRREQPKAYKPVEVSIGPYHRILRKSHLQEMEKNKKRYLKLLLRRLHERSDMNSSKLAEFKSFVAQIRKQKMNLSDELAAKFEREARKCYPDPLVNMISPKEFLKMMLHDGCFIVEFLRKMDRIPNDPIPNRGVKQVRFKEDDPIPNDQSKIKRLICDMLLLENQLPYFVLSTLYEMTKCGEEKSLEEMAMSCFNGSLPRPRRYFISVDKNKSEGEEINHLLHLVHIFCRPSPKEIKKKKTTKLARDSNDNTDEKRRPLLQNSPADSTSTCLPFLARRITKNSGIEESSDDQTRCPLLPQNGNSGNDKSYEMNDHIGTVVELQEVGIKLKKVGKVYTGELKKETENDYVSLFDIDYKCWVMKVPCFKVDNSTKILLRNLIAYEQHFPNVDHKHFTDFAILMNQLIDTKQDAKVLRSKKIIMSFLGDDDDLSKLFNKLAEGVSESYQPYYLGVLQKVHRHCTSTCSILMAKLIHDYFNNPWVGVSTAAAVLLLILHIYSYI